MTTEELLELCRGHMADAVARQGVTERHLRLGGRPVLLRAVGAVADVLRAPLVHLEVDAPDVPPALTIHAWASEGAAPLIDLDRTTAPWTEQLRFADLGDTACSMAWPDEGLVEGFQKGSAEGGGDEAFWWVPDVATTPLFELAMPFRPIAHWWSESIGLQMVHAACVGTPEAGGVLLGGVSGSGKSTTALWALTSPVLRFLGDDYVLVDPDAPEAFSLYSTAKIHEPDQPKVPHVHAEVVGRQEEDKLVAFLDGPYGDRLIERLPITAVLLPRVGGGGPAIEPLSPAVALRRLAPSTVLQFRGADPARVLSAVGRLVRSVPCFDFALGTDPAATPAAIEAFLASR